MGLKGGGGGQGEIVQVQGGHIIRATGRKDRHSKVYTAKGPRDRRVRLSAHTAIQFYDVQDRLGYDRPSKAVDWLIKKAKSAIDRLAELPPWHPNTDAINPDPNGSSGEMGETSGFQFQRQLTENPNNDSTFVPAPMDSDAIGDTLKSFFPTSSGSSSMNFESYPSGDLGLSLHSFQEQNILHGQSQGETSNAQNNDQNLFLENNFQRMVAWSAEANRGGFIFYPPPLQQQQEALVSQASAFPQRGPLQFSFAAPPTRAWDDHSFSHQKTQPSIFGSRFGSDGLPGFCVPGQIHGQEDHGVVSSGPSSSSPSSRR